jgi:hypothetical protein
VSRTRHLDVSSEGCHTQPERLPDLVGTKTAKTAKTAGVGEVSTEETAAANHGSPVQTAVLAVPL